MASTEEVLKAHQNAKITTLAATEPEELVIDAESRTITVPSSERLFGVTGDMNIERKYFRCPKIVGDNVDLSTHQIFIAYVYTETESGSIFPSIGVAPYHCEDVEVDGEDITFSWKLTGNVFKNPGFILFKMYAKKTETDPNTVFNTTPAIGTVLATIPDGTEEIKEEYPDVIAQIFDRLDALESGGSGGTGGTTNYENLSNKPQLNGVTLEGNKTLDQVGVLAKNQGSNNSGKFLSVGSDGNVVPADAPSGGTVDPEQIKQAVNEYLDENPPSGGSGITVALKNALLNLASVVVYKDETSGASAYSALESALSQEVSNITLLKISVVCSVSEVAEKTTADELRKYLTVTAIYSDKSSEVVNDYDLEGTVVIGENIFTVTYNGKSATFMITGVESDSFVKDITQVADVSMNAITGSDMVYAIYNVKAGDIIEYWASWSSSNYNPPKYYDHNPIVEGVDYTQSQTAYGGASLPVDSSEYAHTVLVEYSYGKVTFNPEQDYACVVIRTNPTESTFSEVGATWRRN